jgi:hypothetical protein
VSHAGLRPGCTPWTHAAVAAAFVLFAAGISYPLVVKLATHIPGTGAGDNVSFLWDAWWFRQALLDPELSVFSSNLLFAPFGTSLVLHTHAALPSVAAAILLRPAAIPLAHNLVLLAGLSLNGVAAYALAFHHVRRVLPAVLAGVVFAGSAYVTIHLLGHFNLVHAWVLPLSALAWVRLVENPTTPRALVAACAFAATVYTDYYYFVYMAMFSVLWLPLHVWLITVRWTGSKFPRVEWLLRALIAAALLVIAAATLSGGFSFEIANLRVSVTQIRNPLAAVWVLVLLSIALHVRLSFERSPGAPPLREYAAAAGLVLAGLLVLAAPVAIEAYNLIAAGDYTSPQLVWRSGPKGIDLLTIVLGHPLHVIYGGLTQSVYRRLGIDVVEQAGWIGIVPLALLVRQGRTVLRLDPLARRWVIVGAVFLLWSLGGYAIAGGADTGIPLPQILARLLPIVSNARIPGRSFIVVQLACAMFCAFAVARFRLRSWTTAMILIALAAADAIVAPFPLYELPPRSSIDDTLRRSDGRVLELPVGLRDGLGEIGRFDHRALVFQMRHGRPLAGGFVARLSPRIRSAYDANPAFRSLLRLSGDPEASGMRIDESQDFASGLRELGITHVVVNTDAFSTPIHSLLEAGGLRRVLVDGHRELYTVAD